VEATERIMAAITDLLAEVRSETPPATRYERRRPGAARPGPVAPHGAPASGSTLPAEAATGPTPPVAQRETGE
jgi:hypothetical protein